jgi:hypothetical protein
VAFFRVLTARIQIYLCVGINPQLKIIYFG